MKYRFFFFSLFLCIGTFHIYAQQPSVSFKQLDEATVHKNYDITEFKELPTDISVRTNRVLDKDGKPCALIKINVISNNLEAGAEAISVKKKGINEYWVYVPRTTTSLSLIIDKQNHIVVTFDKLLDNNIEENKTYLLVIAANKELIKQDNNVHQFDLAKRDTDFLKGLKIMMKIDEMIGGQEIQYVGGSVYHSLYEKIVSQPSQKIHQIVGLLKEASDKGVPKATTILAILTEDKVENEYYRSLSSDQEKDLKKLVKWKFINQLKSQYPYSIAFYGDEPLKSTELEIALKEYNNLKCFFRGNKNLDDYWTSPNFGLNAAFLSSISNGILYTTVFQNEMEMSRWYAGHDEMQYVFLALEDMWFNIIDQCKTMLSKNPSMRLSTSKESTREYLNYFVDFWHMDETIKNNRKRK